MDEIFEFTKAELVEAHRLYNVDYLENPNDYESEVDPSEEGAKLQTEKLMYFLKSVQQGKVS